MTPYKPKKTKKRHRLRNNPLITTNSTKNIIFTKILRQIKQRKMLTKRRQQMRMVPSSQQGLG